MAGQLFNKKPTDLEINGPILSITTQPSGGTGIGTTVGSTGGASISMSGIATAVVGSSGSGGSGYLSYQWYEQDVGAVSNGTYITGAASTGEFGSTTTLSVSNLITTNDNNKKFFESSSVIDRTIITKGNEGCLFQGKIYPTEDVPVKDISGAGDTFIAALVVEYIKSNDIIKAINFAQECTKIVVQKHGVSTI